MYNLKTVLKQQKISNFNFNQKLDVNLSKKFILMNPKEINEFISNKLDLEDLINNSYSLINKFFPNSKIYLEYVEDPEYDDFDSIFAYIVLNEGNFETNYQLFNDLLKEFVKLKRLYDDAYSYYYIDTSRNENFLRSKMKSNAQ